MKKNMLLLSTICFIVIIVSGYAIFIKRNTSQTSKTTMPTEEVSNEPQSPLSQKEELADKITLTVSAEGYEPNTVTVKPGETVYVTNTDVQLHTVTSDTPDLFDSGLVGTDEVKTFTAPTEPGEYAYHCQPHPTLKGILVVTNE